MSGTPGGWGGGAVLVQGPALSLSQVLSSAVTSPSPHALLPIPAPPPTILWSPWGAGDLGGAELEGPSAAGEGGQ